MSTLVILGVNFAVLSLFAVGGVMAALPEMHRLIVEANHWMTDRQFADLFALAQAAPGPNMIVVTFIGYHVMGVAGAVVTTGAICGPSCVFAFWVGRVWDRFKDAPWRIIVQRALLPVSIGMIASTAFLIVQSADKSWGAAAITAATAATTYFTRVSPLWLFAAAGIVGVLGWA